MTAPPRFYPSALRCALTALWLAGTAGCASAAHSSAGVAADATTATFVVIRHAEKLDDGSNDPPLSAAGQARAEAMAQRLASDRVEAVYATAYQRTQSTAAPTAKAHALAVVTYDAKLEAAEFAAQLRQRHHANTILVVGHSNTAPDIAAALCGCAIAPMGDNEFDRLMRIRIDAQGQSSVEETQY